MNDISIKVNMRTQYAFYFLSSTRNHFLRMLWFLSFYFFLVSKFCADVFVRALRRAFLICVGR